MLSKVKILIKKIGTFYAPKQLVVHLIRCLSFLHVFYVTSDIQFIKLSNIICLKQSIKISKPNMII